MKNDRKRKQTHRTGPGAGTAAEDRSSSSRALIPAVLIVVLGAVIYANTLTAPFVFDDEQYIVSNVAVRDLRYFSDYLLAADAIASQQLNANFRTRVAAFFTFALNYRVHGLSVIGYHLFNIAIHIGNALLVYWLVLLTFRTPFFQDVRASAGRGGIFHGASLAALFFISHPIQTQAVTYISQRFTSLAAFFCLLSLVLYVQARRGAPESGLTRSSSSHMRSLALYAAASIAVVLAMKTKEIAFTFPLVVALYELFFFHGERKVRILVLLPLLFTMLVIPLTIAGGERIDMVNLAASLDEGGQENRALNYLVTQFRVIVTYLRLLVLPVDQNLDYDYPISTSILQPEVALSLILLICVLGTAIFLYFRSRQSGDRDRVWRRLIAFGIFWFFLMLSVESTVLPLNDVIFEHRLYLPSVGIFLAVVGAIEMAGGRMTPENGKWIMAAAALVIALWSVAAYSRNGVWGDKIALWTDTIWKSPAKARPHNNLGMAYAEKGRYEEAINEYLRAIQLKPTYRAHYNLGIAYAARGRYNDAIREYTSSVQLKPGYVQAHHNLGAVYMAVGRIDKAIEQYETALKMRPDLLQTRRSLELAYIQQQASRPGKEMD